MAEEDIPMPTSTMIPFINTHQVDLASKYQWFKSGSINYIAEGKTFLESKLRAQG